MGISEKKLKFKNIIEKTNIISKKYISKVAFCYLGFSLLTLFIYWLATMFPSFADWYQGGMGAFLRFVMAKLTMWLPFSLAEMIILCIPLFVAITVVFFVKKIKKDRVAGLRRLISLGCAALSFYCMFVWIFGIGFHTTPIDQKLDLQRTDVSAQELYQTAKALAQEVNSNIDQIAYSQNGSSAMPYDRKTMNRLLNEAYQSVGKKYPFIQTMETNIKYIAFSDAMAYTHLTGIYTFYTGEANVNSLFPDYSLIYTCAHELAHQRGISREEEANFVAFLVCQETNDPYIRYSACLNLLIYVSNQLYGADPEAYFEVMAMLDRRAIKELDAYGEFFKKYENSKASEVTDAVNDVYLKGYGQTEGVRSYGLVVDLAVAYYRDSFQ